MIRHPTYLLFANRWKNGGHIVMNAYYLYNGLVVFPEEFTGNGSVLLKDGKIAELNGPCPENAVRVDAKGGYILPGFIDIHVHGGGDADFMDATVDAFQTAARAHFAHGTTALCPTTMTCADELLKRVISCFREAKARQTGGAEMLGMHLEGPFFSAAGKGAQSISEERIPTEDVLEDILAAADGAVLRWDAAPELPNMDMFARVMKRHNVMASVAHTNATAEEALAAFDCGFSHVTHFYNGTSTFHKVNGIVHSGVIEATYIRDDVTIELIGDGRHIPKQSMQLAFRIKGADKIALITDGMRIAGTDKTSGILGARDTGVPVIVKDDVAHLVDFSSYAGSICTMDRAFRTAFRNYGLPICDVCKMLSLTPARLCGVADRKGSLETGKDGDVVVLSPEMTVQHVFTRGEPYTAC